MELLKVSILATGIMGGVTLAEAVWFALVPSALGALFGFAAGRFGQSMDDRQSRWLAIERKVAALLQSLDSSEETEKLSVWWGKRGPLPGEWIGRSRADFYKQATDLARILPAQLAADLDGWIVAEALAHGAHSHRASTRAWSWRMHFETTVQVWIAAQRLPVQERIVWQRLLRGGTSRSPADESVIERARVEAGRLEISDEFVSWRVRRAVRRRRKVAKVRGLEVRSAAMLVTDGPAIASAGEYYWARRMIRTAPLLALGAALVLLGSVWTVFRVMGSTEASSRKVAFAALFASIALTAYVVVALVLLYRSARTQRWDAVATGLLD